LYKSKITARKPIFFSTKPIYLPLLKEAIKDEALRKADEAESEVNELQRIIALTS